MEKGNVLVFDDKSLFLEKFKKHFSDEFKFIEHTFLAANQIKRNENFSTFLFVVYNRVELIEFLQLEKKSKDVLVCLFDEKLHSNTSFFEEINDLILLDGYKTKRASITDLKEHLKKTFKSKEQFAGCITQTFSSQQPQFHRFFKTILFFI